MPSVACAADKLVSCMYVCVCAVHMCMSIEHTVWLFADHGKLILVQHNIYLSVCRRLGEYYDL